VDQKDNKENIESGSGPTDGEISAPLNRESQNPDGKRFKLSYKTVPTDSKKTQIQKIEFLKAYPHELTITHTAAKVGIARETFYLWRDSDPGFAKAMESVDWMIHERAVKVAYKRGFRGSDILLLRILQKKDQAWREKITNEIDPKVIDGLVERFVMAVRRNVPDMCPHCQTKLGLTKKVAKELENLSASFR